MRSSWLRWRSLWRRCAGHVKTRWLSVPTWPQRRQAGLTGAWRLRRAEYHTPLAKCRRAALASSGNILAVVLCMVLHPSDPALRPSSSRRLPPSVRKSTSLPASRHVWAVSTSAPRRVAVSSKACAGPTARPHGFLAVRNRPAAQANVVPSSSSAVTIVDEATETVWMFLPLQCGKVLDKPPLAVWNRKQHYYAADSLLEHLTTTAVVVEH
eukprot:5052465-Amphidinium_carterae.2